MPRILEYNILRHVYRIRRIRHEAQVPMDEALMRGSHAVRAEAERNNVDVELQSGLHKVAVARGDRTKAFSMHRLRNNYSQRSTDFMDW